MKGRLIAIVAALSICSASAEERVATLHNICADGKLFAVAFSCTGDMSMVQVFRRFNKFASPPIPVRCSSSKREKVIIKQCKKETK